MLIRQADMTPDRFITDEELHELAVYGALGDISLCPLSCIRRLLMHRNIDRPVCDLCGEDEIFESEKYQFISRRPFVRISRKGRLVPFWVHRQCAVASPEVAFSGNKYYNIAKAVSRGKKIRCAKCGDRGATVGCMDRRCPKSYHLECTGTLYPY